MIYYTGILSLFIATIVTNHTLVINVLTFGLPADKSTTEPNLAQILTQPLKRMYMEQYFLQSFAMESILFLLTIQVSILPIYYITTRVMAFIVLLLYSVINQFKRICIHQHNYSKS